MDSLPLPPPLLASLLITAGFIALELVGWLILHPRYARLLPFRRPVPEDLPRPKGDEIERAWCGSGERVTWRWHPGSRALLFRRRLEPGRKPYCIGRLHLDARGRWQLQWAPFPFFAWPAAISAWVVTLLALGWAAMPGGALIMGVATLLFLLAIAANLHLSRRAFERVVWPELQRQLREQISL
jgi:hypothetical protein